MKATEKRPRTVGAAGGMAQQEPLMSAAKRSHYASQKDEPTATPGVYKRGRFYRVLTRPDGHRKVMHRFETYEEAVAFKLTTPSRGYRRGRLYVPGEGGPSRRTRHASDTDYLRGDPCAYCGGPAETVDHIHPTVRGGDDDWTNSTAACRSCNSAKGGKPLLIFLAHRHGCWEWRADRAA